jgi:hypothetical protein
MSVRLAREWNITLCGYVRRGRMNVYAHPERLIVDAPLSAQTINAEQVKEIAWQM